MPDFILGSDFFYVAITLAAFGIGFLIQKKWKLAIFNPLLIATILIMAFLLLTGIPNEQYQEGCEVLSWLLTPATICLAISFYEQLGRLKKHLLPVIIGVLCGVVCSIGGIYLMAKAFALPDAILVSLLPKSVTTAIGVVLSEE
jgi:putative effector of murein hydrolase